MADDIWTEENWFDTLKSFDGLRKTQKDASCDVVSSYGDAFLSDRRGKLSDVILLLWMITGAGKTIAALAYLFAINHYINRKLRQAMRVRRALWLTNERTLRGQLLQELANEPRQFGLTNKRPRVQACTKPGDIERPNYDISVCCAQLLWGDPKSSQAQTEADIRREHKIREILSKFDAIVFDECDFASWQIRRIVKLAPHAIKFGLTATPMDADGSIRVGQFVLAGGASYKDVLNEDKCLRPMLSVDEAVAQKYIIAVPHENHVMGVGGTSVEVLGKHDDRHSVDGAYRTMIAAVQSASMLEELWREKFPDMWYSPHIYIKCDGIKLQRHYQEYLETWLATNRHRLIGEGWNVSSINGEDGESCPEFFRAKDMDGRCDKKCSRILFVVDMGTRGVNNWPIQVCADLSFTQSVVVDFQLLGRMGRFPKHLSALIDSMDDDPKIRSLISAYFFYPETESGHQGALIAWDRMVNMHNDMDNCGMKTLKDLLDGDSTPDASQPPEENPLPYVAKISSFVELNKATLNGDVDPDAITALVCGKVPTASSKSVRNYINSITSGAEKLGSLMRPSRALIRPTLRERPKKRDQYTAEDLVFCVSDSPGLFPGHDPDDLIREILSNNKYAFSLAATIKEQEDARSYIPAPVITKIYGSNSITAGLRKDFDPDFRLLGVSNKETQFWAIGSAIKVLYGLAKADEKSLSDAGYHNSLMCRENRKLIKKEAIRILYDDGLIPGLSAGGSNEQTA